MFPHNKKDVDSCEKDVGKKIMQSKGVNVPLFISIITYWRDEWAGANRPE